MSGIMSRSIRRRRAGAAFAATVTVIAMGVATCDRDGTSRPDAQAAPAPSASGATGPIHPVEHRFGVGLEERVLVDPTRPTDAYGEVEAAPDRTIPVTIWYPSTGSPGEEPVAAAGAAIADGPFPLLVFAHGLGAAPETYHRLLATVASQGYVVAGPAFPLTHASVSIRQIRDIPNQAGDVSFVVDEMLAASASTDDPLAGMVDGTRIAVGGHSAGAMTTLLAVFHTCCADDRVDAAIVVAGAMAFGPPEGEYFDGIETPVLFLHGEDDTLVAYDSGRNAFDAAGGPKWFLTLIEGDHASGFINAEPWFPVVEASVVAFLDGVLAGDAAARNRLRTVADQPGVTTLEAIP